MARLASPRDVPFTRARKSSDDANRRAWLWHSSTRAANWACLAVNWRITVASPSTATAASAPLNSAGSVRAQNCPTIIRTSSKVASRRAVGASTGTPPTYTNTCSTARETSEISGEHLTAPERPPNAADPRRSIRTVRTVGVLVLALAMAVILGACGSDRSTSTAASDGSTGHHHEVDSTIADSQPGVVAVTMTDFTFAGRRRPGGRSRWFSDCERRDPLGGIVDKLLNTTGESCRARCHPPIDRRGVRRARADHPTPCSWPVAPT